MPPQSPPTPPSIERTLGRIEGTLELLVDDVGAIRADQKDFSRRIGGLERSRAWARGALALLATGALALLATGAGALGWDEAQTFLLK